MSIQGERLEATIWLETTFPDIPQQQREQFFAAVEAHYEQHPVVERPAHALENLQQHERTFAEILRNVLDEDPPSPPSPSLDLP